MYLKALLLLDYYLIVVVEQIKNRLGNIFLASKKSGLFKNDVS